MALVDTRCRPLLLPLNRTNSWRLSTMLLATVVVIATGLAVTTLLLTSSDAAAGVAYQELRPTPDSAAARFWKDDRDVSIEFVTDRWPWRSPNISLFPNWSHRTEVDVELVAAAGHDNGPDQYMTFEPDRGGFNNIRMQLEVLVRIPRRRRHRRLCDSERGEHRYR